MSPASLLMLCLSLTLIAAAIRAEDEQGDGCSPRTCGNLTISHPFGFVPEQETDTRCGRLGFEVLDIFYGNRSLLVADVHKLGDFQNSSSKGCHVMTANTSSKVGLPFSVSPVNLNLIFYNCTEGRWDCGHQMRRRQHACSPRRALQRFRQLRAVLGGGLRRHTRAGAGGIWRGEREQLRAADQ
ncbi:hypothetical protein E2562_000835 [Oryza meyeriana var. granulata]|uniref:Wall-associated receptor kinase galacturonan-binding domain-containing protein n=1 Tax=Oryza meyeriana var. granulata TaxID=110450 RepID=A0A6G1CYM8_9ORYZ|nr:hypothetical protein E2562_000835 [Oryza meyeriana var. granulata]